MDATPPPEFANHEERIAKLENLMTNLSCEIQSLRTHMDCRFRELEATLRSEFQKQLHEAVEKLNARMDAQYHMIIGLQVAVLLALVALVAA
jgi:hypothetical protein